MSAASFKNLFSRFSYLYPSSFAYFQVIKHIQSSYKVILASQLLLGGFLIYHTVRFTRRVFSRYSLKAKAEVKRISREKQVADIKKKVLKKSQIDIGKERIVLTMNLSDLQTKLMSGETTVEEVALIHLKQVVEKVPLGQYGDADFKLFMQDSKKLTEDIADKLARLLPDGSNDKLDLNQRRKDQEEEIKDEQDEEERKSDRSCGRSRQNNSQFAQLEEPEEGIQLKRLPMAHILQERKLLGLVIALGDSIMMDGLFTSKGMMSTQNQVANDYNDLVKHVMSQGGLIMLKGNPSLGQVPFLKAQNLIWGTAFNPWNQKRTSGFSSEASLVADRVVNFAITKDIIGEQLVNAMFNGVPAFSSSTKRLSSEMLESHWTKKDNGPEITPARVCLTAKYVQDLRIVIDGLLSPEENNIIHQRYPRTLATGFDNDVYHSDKPLIIGHTDIFCCSTMKRAILTSQGHLASLGHSLKKIEGDELPFQQEIFAAALRLYFNVNFTNNKELISNVAEHTTSYGEIVDKLQGKQGLLKTLINLIFRGRSQRDKTIESCFIPIKTASELLNLLSELQTLRSQALQKLNEKYACDLYLTPVFPVVAPSCTSDHEVSLLPGFTHSLYWQTLGFASGLIPTNLVNIEETTFSDPISDSFTKEAQRVMSGDSTGMPVGVQISGTQDEQVLRVMREMQDKAKFKLPLNFKE